MGKHMHVCVRWEVVMFIYTDAKTRLYEHAFPAIAQQRAVTLQQSILLPAGIRPQTCLLEQTKPVIRKYTWCIDASMSICVQLSGSQV